MSLDGDANWECHPDVRSLFSVILTQDGTGSSYPQPEMAPYACQNQWKWFWLALYMKWHLTGKSAFPASSATLLAILERGDVRICFFFFFFEMSPCHLRSRGDTLKCGWNTQGCHWRGVPFENATFVQCITTAHIIFALRRYLWTEWFEQRQPTFIYVWARDTVGYPVNLPIVCCKRRNNYKMKSGHQKIHIRILLVFIQGREIFWLQQKCPLHIAKD